MLLQSEFLSEVTDTNVEDEVRVHFLPFVRNLVEDKVVLDWNLFTSDLMFRIIPHFWQPAHSFPGWVHIVIPEDPKSGDNNLHRIGYLG